MTHPYSIRPFTRKDEKSLDGAFKVHLSSKELNVLKLLPGEPCRLTTAVSPAVSGLGIVALDPEKITQHIVRVTELFRAAYGFHVGDKVIIVKSGDDMPQANKVHVRPLWSEGNLEKLADKLKFYATNTLANLRIVATGATFEVIFSEGLQKRSKIPFEILKVDGWNPNPLGPYLFDDLSAVEIELEKSSAAAMEEPLAFVLDPSSLGGLQTQIEELNKQLKLLLSNIRTIPSALRGSRRVLLWGPAGTGKTLVIEKLMAQPWRKVLKVDHSTLGSYPSEKENAIRKIFSEARLIQPSLIVLDKLNTIAGRVDREGPGSVLATVIANELKKLGEAQVMVIAATRSLNDIDQELRSFKCFHKEIEIPVPDAKARLEIMKTMSLSEGIPDDVLNSVGERTHGFVGQDLEQLFTLAWEKPSLEDINNPPPYTENEDEPYESIARLPGLENFEEALKIVHPSALKEIFFEPPKIQWTDIGGYDSVKKELIKETVLPIKRPDLPKKYGNNPPMRNVLLYGPPGCSKTLLAQAVATESRLNFIAVKGAELTSMYVGETERAVREIFRKARAASPSIIFFDEVDSIGSARGGGSHVAGLNTVTTLLNEMDGIERSTGVVVIGATNHPEALDPGLLRPGRFHKRIYVGPPDREARKKILEINLGHRPLADDVDIEKLAMLTEGFSGAEIVGICNEAGAAAQWEEWEARSSHCINGKITRAHLETALANETRQITEEMVDRFIQWGRR